MHAACPRFGEVKVHANLPNLGRERKARKTCIGFGGAVIIGFKRADFGPS